MLFDSTPDSFPTNSSHQEQTTQVLRYVVMDGQTVKIEESFIGFLETKEKTAEVLSEMILRKLHGDGLDIGNCREQTYDNAASMAGKITGVQQRIKDVNPKA